MSRKSKSGTMWKSDFFSVSGDLATSAPNRHSQSCRPALILLLFLLCFSSPVGAATDLCEEVQSDVNDVAGKVERLENIDKSYKENPPYEPGCFYYIGLSFYNNRDKKPGDDYLDRAISHFKYASQVGQKDLRGIAKMALIEALIEKQSHVEYGSRETLLFEAFGVYDDIKNAFQKSRELGDLVRLAIQSHLEEHKKNPMSTRLNERTKFLPISRQLNIEQSLLPEETYQKITQYEELAGQPKSRENVNTVAALLQEEIGDWVDENQKITYTQLASFYTKLEEGISAGTQNNHSHAATLYSQAKEALISAAIPPGSDSHLDGIAREVDCRQNRSKHFGTLQSLLEGSLKPTGSKDLAAVQAALQTINGQKKTLDSLSQPCQSHSLDWDLFDPQLEELTAYYQNVEALHGPDKEPDFLSTYYHYATSQNYKDPAGLHLARHFYDQIANFELTGDPEQAKNRLKVFWRGPETYMEHLKDDSKRTKTKLQQIYGQHLAKLSQKAIDAFADIKTPLDPKSEWEAFDKLLELAEDSAMEALSHAPDLDMTEINQQKNSLTTFKKHLDGALSEEDYSKFLIALEKAKDALNDTYLHTDVTQRLRQEISEITSSRDSSIAADKKRHEERYEEYRQYVETKLKHYSATTRKEGWELLLGKTYFLKYENFPPHYMQEIAKVLGIKEYIRPFVEQVFHQSLTLYLKNNYTKAAVILEEAIHWLQETEDTTWKKKTAALAQLCRYLETFESQGDNAQLDTKQFHGLATQYFALAKPNEHGPKEITDMAAASVAITEIRNLIKQNSMDSYKKAWDYFFDTTTTELADTPDFTKDKLFLPEHSFITGEREVLKNEVVKGIIALRDKGESYPYWPDGVEKQQLLAAISEYKRKNQSPPPTVAKDQSAKSEKGTRPAAAKPSQKPIQPQQEPTDETLPKEEAPHSTGEKELKKIKEKISQAMKLLKDFHFQAAYKVLHDSYPDLIAVEKKLPESAKTTHLYPLAATRELALQLNGFEMILELDIANEFQPQMNGNDYFILISQKITTTMKNDLASFKLHESKRANPISINFGTRYEDLGGKQRYRQYFVYVYWKILAKCREGDRKYDEAAQNYKLAISKATNPFQLENKSFQPLMEKLDPRITTLQQKQEEMERLEDTHKSQQIPSQLTEEPDPSFASNPKNGLPPDTTSLEEKISKTIEHINSFRLTTHSATEAFGKQENQKELLSIADNMHSIIRDSKSSNNPEVPTMITKMCTVFVNMSTGLNNNNDLRKALGVIREIENTLANYMKDLPAHDTIKKGKEEIMNKHSALN